MYRRLTYLLGISLVLAVGCKGGDRVVGAPTSGVAETRTLAEMLPNIKKSLTPPLTEQTFGRPDQTAGSGLVILIYNVENDRKVNLAFPGPTALITNAFVQEKNGGTTPIPILD
jgi:hypothetical protein